MSLLAVQGGATGTGTVTLLAPVTNTNRTLTLPDVTGTVLDSTGGTTQTALTVTNGASIQGLTVGRGAGAVATNTAVGTSALASNTTASNSTAVGYQAGYNATGGFNTIVGSATTGGATFSGTYNTLMGYGTGNSLTTGSNNTFIGTLGLSNYCGASITTGSKNTIIGGFGGNQGGLDIRTASNNIVLSDGDGNPRLKMDSTGQLSSLIVGVGLYEAYGCRAWVNFNGTGTPAIRGSGNVSSITDNATGDYTVNFTTAMPDGNYAAIPQAHNPGIASGIANFVNSSRGAGSARMVTYDDAGGAQDCAIIDAAFFR